MTPSEDLKNYLASTGLSAGFRVQFGMYEADNPADKYLVIRPQNGGNAALIRYPYHSIILVGEVNSSRFALLSKANAIIEAMRSNVHSSGRTFNMQSSEPVFFQTDDKRPVFELSIEMLYS
jgi:hypothetical protein